MTLPIQVNPIMTQEKREKHVFRKSKKYRTLCSVAFGTVATAVIALGGGVAQADELTAATDTPLIVRTDNPATNLVEAQPAETDEHDKSLAETGQSQGTMPVTIDETALTSAVEKAEAEGVTVVSDSTENLGTTSSSHETSAILENTKTDLNKQVTEVDKVTNQFKSDKEAHNQEVKRIETENALLQTSHEEATSAATTLEKEVNATVDQLSNRFSETNVFVSVQTLPSGSSGSVNAYEDYTKAVQAIDRQNKAATKDYLSKKVETDAIKARNQEIEAENKAGLEKARADNEAISKRNREGLAAIEAENKRGQAAVNQTNKDNEAHARNRQEEIEAIKRRNAQKQAEADQVNKENQAYNAQELARYQRELAEIQKGEEGYISEALAQALNLNQGEPQAQHGAVTREPDRIISTGDAMLGGYSHILDSTGFFVYDQFTKGETLRFNYQNLQHASFSGKKITGVTYDITNLESPTGTNSVMLLVPNDPTEGFIAYRGDGTGNWREDKMEFRVQATYTLSDGNQVTFSQEAPGVFTHSSLNHNDVGLEYVKDSSGKFVSINGSTIQVTNEGLARSLGSNRAHDIGTPEEWDTTSSRYAYKGAIVSTVTSGSSYSVTFGQGDMPSKVGGKTYWFALNTLPVARTVAAYHPKPTVTPELEPIPDPLPITPLHYTPKTFTPEPEVRFTPKPTTPVEEPHLKLVKVTSPTKPTYEKLPNPPVAPTIHVHSYSLQTKPGIHKDVENSDHASIDQHLVAKSSAVNYPLVVEEFSSNRVKTSSLIFEDFLPAGYVLNKQITADENSAYEVAYDSNLNKVRLSAKEQLLAEINKDLTKPYRLTPPVLYGTVVNDGATYTNTYKLHINQGTPTAYTVTSNPVTVRTPGDGRTTSHIKPDKINKNSDGVTMNDTVVLVGSTNHYTLTWDLDQYKGDKSSSETIAKGFFMLDDFPEEALITDDQAVTVTTTDGTVVQGFTAKTYQSMEGIPQTLKNQLKEAKISPKGAFQVIIPDDNQVFYDTYVKTGTSLLVTSPMVVRSDLTNKTLTYQNKAYQVDFGNGYSTKEVTNHIVTPEPRKKNLNADKVDIHGQAMLIGSKNFYTLSWDLDQYQGIEATKDAISKGFYFVDDYPEEALDIDNKAIQVITKDGVAVSDIVVETYEGLEEAPDNLKVALANKKLSPKGAFQVFRPKDNQAFYETYVKTGQSLTIIDPMTVKASLYNTGKTYINRAIQVDFGMAYETEEVSNSVPIVSPKKSNTNDKGVMIDGKTVLPDTVNYYKIVLDYSAYKGMSASKDQIQKGFYMVDDYPEEALLLHPDRIQMVDSKGQSVRGLSVTSYASLSEAPQRVQEALATRGFTPKGAIQVFTADDPQDFYETYVKAGQTIVITNPMTLKSDVLKTGGDYKNTAYQLDFGLAYVTDTIVNNVPKLNPQKDVVVDFTHKDESLDGKEIALDQVFNYRLKGALIPAKRATALTEYGFKDDYDETHDQYDGVYQAYLMSDVTLNDGSVLKAGSEVTKYTLQTVDTNAGLVSIAFDQAFLSDISDDSSFQAEIYLQMKRIAAGEVENTFVHTVNGVEITSNTVKTKTPEPVTPPKPTPPSPEIPNPTPPIPVSPENSAPTPPPSSPVNPTPNLPQTGEASSLLGLIGGGLLLGVAYGVLRKKKVESEESHV